MTKTNPGLLRYDPQSPGGELEIFHPATSVGVWPSKIERNTSSESVVLSFNFCVSISQVKVLLSEWSMWLKHTMCLHYPLDGQNEVLCHCHRQNYYFYMLPKGGS